MNKINLKEILSLLHKVGCNYTLMNELDIEIDGINNPNEAKEDQMIFIGEERSDYLNLIKNTNSKLVILSYKYENDPELKLFPLKQFLFVDNPRFYFATIYNSFFHASKASTIAITSIISKHVVIGKNVTVGEFTVIEDDCIIGDDCFIDSNVTIKSKTILGKSVRIYAGAVIGSDGFGFIKNGSLVINFPHIAGVEIGEGAEIGANTVIDRGSLTNTCIGAFTKVDNLCHIAHNVKIGKNCFVIANSMIGGSTSVGDNTWLAPSSSLRDGLKIGSNVTIGMGSVVTKNVPENEIWAGNPACRMDELKKRIKKISEI